jgi:hypothetical protein
LLRTPNSYLGSNGGSQPSEKRLAGGHQPSLADQVEQDLDPMPLLPTPRTGDNRNSRVAVTGANAERHGRTARGSASGLGLEQALEVMRGEVPRELQESWRDPLLPTPRTTDRGSTEHPSPSTLTGSHGRDLAPTVGALLPTPRVQSGGGSGAADAAHAERGFRPNLATEVDKLLPMAADGERSRGKTGGGGGAGFGLRDATRNLPLFPTPSAGVHNDGETLESWEARRARLLAKDYNGNGQGTPLPIAVQELDLLPTPTSADGDRTSPSYPRGNPTLGGALLPTPTQGGRGAGGVDPRDRAEGANLSTAVDELPVLPTPTARLGKGPGTSFGGRVRSDGRVRGDGDATLSMRVEGLPGALLPTPRPADGISGTPNQRGSSGDLMLAPAVLSLGLPPGMLLPTRPAETAALLPTPGAADGLGGHLTRSGDRGGEELLPKLARSASEGRRLAQRGSTGSSTARRSRGGKMSPDSGHPTLFDPPS